MNLLTSPFSWWFQFPLLGWGIVIFLHRMAINYFLSKELSPPPPVPHLPLEFLQSPEFKNMDCYNVIGKY